MRIDPSEILSSLNLSWILHCKNNLLSQSVCFSSEDNSRLHQVHNLHKKQNLDAQKRISVYTSQINFLMSKNTRPNMLTNTLFSFLCYYYFNWHHSVDCKIWTHCLWQEVMRRKSLHTIFHCTLVRRSLHYSRSIMHTCCRKEVNLLYNL